MKLCDFLGENRSSWYLLDIDMPGGSGLDVLKAMKKRGFDIPSIVISGSVTATVGDQLVQHGVQAMVIKPFSLDRISQEIQQVIGSRYPSESDAGDANEG